MRILAPKFGETMIKLFYQDKVILFETNNNGYPQKDVVFENNPVVEQLLCLLEGREQLVIVSENEDRAFAHFARDLKPVTAAGGLVENAEGEQLMILRNGRWDLPKGKLESDESLDECAVREVMEETGIDGIKVVGLPIVTKHFYNYNQWELKTTYWYNMSYDCAADKRSQKTFVPQEVEGITKCEWLSPTKVNLLIHGSYATIREVVEILTKNRE